MWNTIKSFFRSVWNFLVTDTTSVTMEDGSVQVRKTSVLGYAVGIATAFAFTYAFAPYIQLVAAYIAIIAMLVIFYLVQCGFFMALSQVVSKACTKLGL